MSLSHHSRRYGLFPHQARAAETVFQAPSGRWILSGPPGSGKTFLASYLLSRVMDDSTHPRRVLLIAPTSYQPQFLDLVAGDSTNVIQLTRANFRFYTSELEGRNVLRQPGQLFVATNTSTARHPDVLKTLFSITWDFAVVDEGHLLQSEGLAALLRDFDIVRKLLVLTGAPADAASLEWVRPAMEIQWTREERDWDGSELFDASRRKQNVIKYERSSEERRVLERLDAFTSELRKLDPDTAELRSHNLALAASSSPAALEQFMLRIQRELVRGGREVAVEIADDLGDEVDIDAATSPIPVSDRLLKVSAVLLEEISHWSKDTKLTAFLAFAETLINERGALAVISQLRATADYVSYSSEELSFPTYRISGTDRPEARLSKVEDLARTGGVLVSTDAGLWGNDLSWIEDAVSYDLPRGSGAMLRRWGIVDTVARVRPCTMHAFLDTSEALSYEQETLRRFGFLR